MNKMRSLASVLDIHAPKVLVSNERPDGSFFLRGHPVIRSKRMTPSSGVIRSLPFGITKWQNPARPSPTADENIYAQAPRLLST